MTAAPVDGRSARALRTRDAIVDACIGLVEEGELRPTAPQVAERADVSVRSVFQHFDDLPSLHSAVAERIVQRLAALLIPIDTTLPFEEKVDAFVRHRAALLEAVTPYRRAANVHGPFAPEIRRSVQNGIEHLRDEMTTTFLKELDALGEHDRRIVAEGLNAILSWSAWEALRAEAGCDLETAVAVTTRVVRALLR